MATLVEGFIQAVVADLIVGGILFATKDLLNESGLSDTLWFILLVVFILLPWLILVLEMIES